MLAGDDAILVNSLGGSAYNRLEVLTEVAGLELRVKFWSQVVAEVTSVLGIIVAANTPGVLVLGQVAGDELDRVEWIGLASLSGGQDTAANGLLGNLPSKRQYRKNRRN